MSTKILLSIFTLSLVVFAGIASGQPQPAAAAESEAAKPNQDATCSPNTLSGPFSQMMEENIKKAKRQKAEQESESAVADPQQNPHEAQSINEEKTADPNCPATAPKSEADNPSQDSTGSPNTLSGPFSSMMEESIKKAQSQKEAQSAETAQCDPTIKEPREIVGYRTIQAKGRQHREPIYADGKR